MAQREITFYVVVYSANTFNPRIFLMTGNKQGIGQLVFFPDGTPLPLDFQRPNGQVDLHYHRQDFPNLIDILRNEHPLFLNFNGSGPGFENTITTTSEPIGEGIDKPS
jgi:hypothetical protein